jgi:opacity protein-like surface antigen
MAHTTTGAAAAALMGAILFLPLAAQAQTTGATATPTGTDYTTGFYIGGSIGESNVKGVCDFAGVGCDEEEFAWKLYGGMQINKWLAAELGYLSFGTVDLHGNFQGTPVSGEVKTWGLTAHAVGQLPIPIAALHRFALLGKVGGIWYDRERATNIGAITGDDTGFSFAWGVGAQYTFSERIGIRAEWERFEDVGDSSSGNGDVDLWTVGLNYKF